MTGSALRLGPFAIGDELGRGGMGIVFRGRHTPTGTPVAVKVLTAERARHANFVAAFRREARSLSRLNHPGIIRVFDYGQLDSAAAAAMGGLSASSPYLIMELARGGTLEAAGLVVDWSSLREVLLQILEALSHAHARQVIHRDLKPENMLVTPQSELPGSGPRIVLADFGLAHAVVREDSGAIREDLFRGKAAGTPAYMAPEQFLGRYRDFGPWTDLYALGVVAYELCCRQRPFVQDETSALVEAHLSERVPPLVPWWPIPRGFEPWVRHLLAKQPADRFRFAADAAWALRGLGEVDAPSEHFSPPRLSAASALDAVTQSDVSPAAHPATTPGRPPLPDIVGSGPVGPPDPFGRRSHSTHATDRSSAAGTTRADLPGGPERHAGTDASLASRGVEPRPGLPASWRHASASRAGFDHLTGSGKGLVGLRTIPLVAREAERDQLWATLHRVREAGSGRVVVIRGASGVGKSRLARWLCERAHELGGASSVNALHDASGRVDGLAELAHELMGSAGLTGEELIARVRQVVARPEHGLDTTDLRALVSLVDQANHGDRGDGLREPSRLGLGASGQRGRERFAAVYRLLRRASRQRPVIVWLDDVQWGLTSLRFCQHVLDVQHRRPAPVLLLLTVQDEALAERPDATGALSALCDDGDVETISLGPLDESGHAELLERLLGLDDALIRSLAKRTGGNPLFAEQLVLDWVGRGVLLAGRTGFRLHPEAELELPDSLHEMWERRLERLMSGRSERDSRSLEIAAALGLRVDLREWRAVCQRAGDTAAEDLLEVLYEQRLAESAPDGFTFAHPMLRESIGRTARERDRWAAANRFCAFELEERGRYGLGRGQAERIALHRLEAGDEGAALDPLLLAARERRSAGELERAFELLVRRDKGLERLNRPAEHVDWCSGWVERSAVQAAQGRLLEAIRLAEKAQFVAELASRDDLIVLALAQHATAIWRLGRGQVAEALFQRLIRITEQHGWLASQCEALVQLGNIAQHRGHLDEAEALCRRAVDLCEAGGIQPQLYGRCQMYLAFTLMTRRQYDEARRRLTDARRQLEALGERYLAISCRNSLAEIDRFEGRLDAAAAGYREVLEGLEAMGSVDVNTALTNLGLVLLATGEASQALQPLEEALAGYRRSRQEKFIGGALLNLLPSLADTSNWRRWDKTLAEARTRFANHRYVDPDDAWTAKLGADLAAEAGQLERAIGAYRLAADQYEALDRQAELDAARAALEAAEDALIAG